MEGKSGTQTSPRIRILISFLAQMKLESHDTV
jgi:hypothetical protein